MTDFLTMRASLVQRGLITADFRLTDAGRAHTDALMASLVPDEAWQQFGWGTRVFNFSRERGRVASHG